MNGHFAAVGNGPTADYEHGIQVIDDDKAFKFVNTPSARRARMPGKSALLTSFSSAARISMSTSPRTASPRPASTTT